MSIEEIEQRHRWAANLYEKGEMTAEEFEEELEYYLKCKKLAETPCEVCTCIECSCE